MQNPDDLLNLYFLARNVEWRYRLDQYEAEVIRDMLRRVEDALNEIMAEEIFYGKPRSSAEVVAELEALSVALRKRLGEDVAHMSSVAAEASARTHASILSVGGLIAVNGAALSADQFRSFLAGRSGGTSLPAWVDAAWGRAVSERIKRQLDIGVLRGEGYPKLVRRLLNEGFEQFARRDAVTIARTYVQTANVAAQMSLYEANKDLVKAWKWCAVLEPGYMKTGRGTCLQCAALDGQVFKVGEGPSIPRHPNCRCVGRPVTKTWHELGIDLDELQEAARPYTIRPDKNIDAGGRRTIIEAGQHRGDYASWFEKRDRKFKLNAVGPGRLELLESGVIQFKDMVDRKGNLRTLEELRGMAG